MNFCTLKPGDRVRMTRPALRMGLNGRLDRRAGVVVRYCRDVPWCVYVRRAGESRSTGYAAWFWRRSSDGRVGRALP